MSIFEKGKAKYLVLNLYLVGSWINFVSDALGNILIHGSLLNIYISDNRICILICTLVCKIRATLDNNNGQVSLSSN
jgi:hypothetical protein